MSEPSIKQTEPMTVAFLPMRGAYRQVPLALGRLYAWVSQQGLTPAGMPVAEYLSNPQVTPEDEALWEVWAPVAEQPGLDEAQPGDAGIGVKRIPAMTVATVMHRGPYETMAETYESLGAWVAEQGYVMAGAPREAYHSDPAKVPPEEYLTEVSFPVQRI